MKLNFKMISGLVMFMLSICTLFIGYSLYKYANRNSEADDKGQELIVAAGAGNLEKVRLLIQSGANINVRDRNNLTALIWAQSSENAQSLDITTELLLKDDSKTSNYYGCTALQLAAEQGLSDNTKLLIRHGAIINAQDENGHTAIHLLLPSIHCNLQAVKALLQAGANVNIPDKEGVTPLAQAIAQGNPTITQLCALQNGNVNTIGTNGTPLLVWALNNRNDAVIKYVMKKGVDVNKTSIIGETSLTTAIRNGYFKIAGNIVERGANLNTLSQDGIPPLQFAIAAHQIGLARLLVKRGSDVNKVNKQGESALIIAARTGQVEMVRLLLSNGADRNKVDSSSRNARQWSIESGYPAIANLLAK